MFRPLFALTLVCSSAALGFELKRDSTGEHVHWNGNVRFVVDERLEKAIGDPETFAAIESAIHSYELATPGLAVSVGVGPTVGMGYDARPGAINQNEVLILEDWPFDEKTIAATVTTFNLTTHEIVDADIALNGKYRKFSVLPNAEAYGSNDDLENTLSHELGHALGLDHNPESPTSVMFPKSKKGETKKRILTKDDLAALIFLYPAVDGQTTAPGASELDAQAVGCSASGRTGNFAYLLAAIAPFALLRRNPLKAGLLALAIPSAVFASVDSRSEEVRGAEVIVQGDVTSTRASEAEHSKLWKTEVELRVTLCIKGPCPEQLRFVVQGGRRGNFEQTVGKATVPQPGAKVAVALGKSHGVFTFQTALFALDDPRELAQFKESLISVPMEETKSSAAADLARPKGPQG